MKNLILLLRPQQWVKNMFIFLPLFFHGDLTNIPMLINAVIAFFCYSFAASSIYCFNDIYDVEADRKHPKKCKRPIASGAVSIFQAYGLMALMLFLSLNLAFLDIGRYKHECNRGNLLLLSDEYRLLCEAKADSLDRYVHHSSRFCIESDTGWCGQ